MDTLNPTTMAGPVSSASQTEGNAVASKTPSYSEAASVFLQSASIGVFLGAAKTIVSELKGADGGLNKCELPHKLTPLHIAALVQDMELLGIGLKDSAAIELLTQRTAALSVDDLAVTIGDKTIPLMNDDPALHFALFMGWDEGATKLIGALRSHDKFEPTYNNTGNSLLNLAAGKCNAEVMELLYDALKEHALSQLTPENPALSEEAKETGVKKSLAGLVNRPTSPGGSTPLHHAATSGKPDVFSMLLEKGAGGSLSLKDAGERTPLDHVRQRLRKMEASLKELKQKKPEKGTLKMEVLEKEVKEWKALLAKHDKPQEEAVVPEGALKV